jgi:hypothetical protein
MLFLSIVGSMTTCVQNRWIEGHFVFLSKSVCRSDKVKSIFKINLVNFQFSSTPSWQSPAGFLKIFKDPYLYFSFSTHNSTMFSLKNLYRGGSWTRISVSEADAMSTAPRRQTPAGVRCPT